MSNPSKYHGEEVLVISAEHLRLCYPRFFERPDSFVAVGDGETPNLLLNLFSSGSFVGRDLAEDDERLKQFIPYALILQDGKVLIYTRGKVGGEKRLHAKRSIGVGGHINPEDVVEVSGDGFGSALIRELEEEIGIDRVFIQQMRFAGIVNEDSEAVGRVHIGMVFIVEIDSAAKLTFENCLVDPEWMAPADLTEGDIHSSLEGWSRLVVSGLDNILSIPERVAPEGKGDTLSPVGDSAIHEATLSGVQAVLVDLLGVDHSQVVETSDLASDLDVDSLDFVEIVMSLEERFDIEILDEEAEKAKTVGDVARLVDSKLQ